MLAPKPPPAPKPTITELQFIVGENTNPDLRGRPSPIVVRLYELKSLAAFQGADFFGIFERDRESLGAELVMRDEVTLTPGEKRHAVRTLHHDTQYVGVVAAFRDLERARWRVTAPVVLNRTTRMEIRLDRHEMVIISSDPSSNSRPQHVMEQ